MNKQNTITIHLKDYMSAAQKVTEICFSKNAVTVQFINTLNGRKQIKTIAVQKKLINEHEAKEFNMF